MVTCVHVCVHVWVVACVPAYLSLGADVCGSVLCYGVPFYRSVYTGA